MSAADLYDRDFYAWAVRNAELLRSGHAEQADLTHIAEEIEDMGKRERRALQSRLGVLIGHLLKWQAQPELRSRSWQTTIRIQRREIAKLLADSPSLRRFLAENLGSAYEDGKLIAAAETNLPEEALPESSPFDLDQILSESFLP
jgi:hypothetical protein